MEDSSTFGSLPELPGAKVDGFNDRRARAPRRAGQSRWSVATDSPLCAALCVGVLQVDGRPSTCMSWSLQHTARTAASIAGDLSNVPTPRPHAHPHPPTTTTTALTTAGGRLLLQVQDVAGLLCW